MSGLGFGALGVRVGAGDVQRSVILEFNKPKVAAVVVVVVS